MGGSLRYHVSAHQPVASPRHVSDRRPGGRPFGGPQSGDLRETGGKDLEVGLMAACESRRAYEIYFHRSQASSLQARLPTLASFWRQLMVVCHHGASLDPWGPLVAAGHHYPFLVLDGVSRVVDAAGRPT